MSTTQLNPLLWNVRIVDDNGLPTQQFVRQWAQQTGINNDQTAGAAAALLAAQNAQDTANEALAESREAGFGFFTTGLYANNELLGQGVFTAAITFPLESLPSVAIATVPAAATSALRLVVGGTEVGTITFAMGATAATIAWSSPPYTLPADTPIQLFAPLIADTQLSGVNGLLLGSL